MKELRLQKHKAMPFEQQVIALALCYPAGEFATKLGVIAGSLCGYPLRLGIYAILAVAQRAFITDMNNLGTLNTSYRL